MKLDVHPAIINFNSRHSDYYQLRQVKYINNRVENDYKSVKRKSVRF
jgi:transposase-like protein